MALLTRIVGLFSGQGMAHLVEFYDNGDPTTAPDALVLIDFGGGADDSSKAIEYIVGKLALQTPPTFDCVLISHQDLDHTGRLTALRKAIKTAGLTYAIGQIYAGGRAWKPGSKGNVKGFIAGSTSKMSDPTFLETFRSDYPPLAVKGPPPKKAEFQHPKGSASDEVFLRILAAQVKECGDKDANGSGAIGVIENSNAAIVLPGDATYGSMDYINRELFMKWKGITPRPLPSVGAIEIPHHGALDSAIKEYVDPDDKMKKRDWKVVVDFVANMDARRVFASAGPFNQWGHPLQEVVDRFMNPKLEPAPKHTYVAAPYDGRPARTSFDGFFKTQKIETSMYTTVTWVRYDYLEDTKTKKQKAVNPDWRDTNILIDLTLAGVTMRADRTLNEILADPGGEHDTAETEAPVVYAPAPARPASGTGP